MSSFAHANTIGNSCLSLHVCRKWGADLSSSLGFPNMLRTLWCDNAKFCLTGFYFLLKNFLLFVVMHSLFLCFAELDNKATLSDHILTAVLGLLKKEVPEHGRHLQQYFHFFLMYSMIGPPEVCILISVQLIRPSRSSQSLLNRCSGLKNVWGDIDVRQEATFRKDVFASRTWTMVLPKFSGRSSP